MALWHLSQMSSSSNSFESPVDFLDVMITSSSLWFWLSSIALPSSSNLEKALRYCVLLNDLDTGFDVLCWSMLEGLM
ncbi:hypothetical protein WICPIJ_000117 [Wickerhamomyces pijperi]|uniref:Uncharacterized protein n=1 Tax=Wickerhamomyces pijperi TaxID=599730 RepID=A0A9P8QED5_WICPI|nr:hypothetical protein WICPIJ_000117 [Wickerhamomyces pijperi]